MQALHLLLHLLLHLHTSIRVSSTTPSAIVHVVLCWQVLLLLLGSGQAGMRGTQHSLGRTAERCSTTALCTRVTAAAWPAPVQGHTKMASSMLW